LHSSVFAFCSTLLSLHTALIRPVKSEFSLNEGQRQQGGGNVLSWRKALPLIVAFEAIVAVLYYLFAEDRASGPGLLIVVFLGGLVNGVFLFAILKWLSDRGAPKQ
jgi:hypothetical protein